MKRGRQLAAVGLAAACVLLTGCAAQQVTGLKAPAARLGTPPVTNGEVCRFTVKSIADRRDDKSLGKLASTKVSGDGFADWFANGLASVPGYTAGDAPVELRVEVLKAYIQGLSTLKSANLVVRVNAVQGGPPKVTTYRGVDGSMNWNSTESEVQEAFDRALVDLQQQIGADIARTCRL